MTTFSFQIHPNYRPRQMPKIDRPNSRLYGLVAGMDVEATGHGICCDVKALEQIAKLANTHPEGISGRFGHPGMSENATGRKIQLAYHWRVLKGEKADDPHTYLVHDAQLMDAARTSPAFAQDPIEYIMRMAEQYPQHFGESLVLSGDAVWTTKDGQELPLWEDVEDEDGATTKRPRPRPANALTKVPVMRPTAIHFCDFVNDSAITHTGLFPMASPPGRGGTTGGCLHQHLHRRKHPPIICSITCLQRWTISATASISLWTRSRPKSNVSCASTLIRVAGATPQPSALYNLFIFNQIISTSR